jgi:hypothetical protein
LDATQVKMDETKEDMRVDREKMKAEMHAWNVSQHCEFECGTVCVPIWRKSFAIFHTWMVFSRREAGVVCELQIL